MPGHHGRNNGSFFHKTTPILDSHILDSSSLILGDDQKYIKLNCRDFRKYSSSTLHPVHLRLLLGCSNHHRIIDCNSMIIAGGWHTARLKGY